MWSATYEQWWSHTCTVIYLQIKLWVMANLASKLPSYPSSISVLIVHLSFLFIFSNPCHSKVKHPLFLFWPTSFPFSISHPPSLISFPYPFSRSFSLNSPPKCFWKRRVFSLQCSGRFIQKGETQKHSLICKKLMHVLQNDLIDVKYGLLCHENL